MKKRSLKHIKYADGGKPPKKQAVYTDRNQYLKAKQAYEDSAYIANQERLYNQELDRLKSEYPLDLFTRGAELDKFERRPAFQKNIELQNRLNVELPQTEEYIYTDAGKEYYSDFPYPVMRPLYKEVKKPVSSLKVKPTQTIKPKPKIEPIIVTNPNDPRLKAYSDSLRLYNLSNYIQNTPLDWDAQAVDKLKELYNINSKIKPIGKADTKITTKDGYGNIINMGWKVDKYKKPVQPVIYQKPKPKPTSVDTTKTEPVKPKPTVTQQQPVKPMLFRAKYSMPDTSANPNMQGEYPLQMFYQPAATQAEADSIEQAMNKKRIELQNYMRNLPKKATGGMVNDNPLEVYGKGGYTVTRSSDRKGKTHKVTGPDGSVKYFGDPNMGERGKSKYGKEAFYARHAKNLKNNPHFRAYARATWANGGMLPIEDFDYGPTEDIVLEAYGQGGEMIKRADGSYSRRGLWDNIRANRGSGKKPTKEMLEQERKIKAEEKAMGGYMYAEGGINNPGFNALPPYVQAKIKANMAMGGEYEAISMADGGIHIKPENRGKFTAWAKSKGMGVQEAASHVLANKDRYSPTVVKRANFAHNAAKWKHAEGGYMPKYAIGGKDPINNPYDPVTQPREYANFLRNQPTVTTPNVQDNVPLSWTSTTKGNPYNPFTQQSQYAAWEDRNKSIVSNTLAPEPPAFTPRVTPDQINRAAGFNLVAPPEEVTPSFTPMSGSVSDEETGSDMYNPSLAGVMTQIGSGIIGTGAQLRNINRLKAPGVVPRVNFTPMGSPALVDMGAQLSDIDRSYREGQEMINREIGSGAGKVANLAKLQAAKLAGKGQVLQAEQNANAQIKNQFLQMRNEMKMREQAMNQQAALEDIANRYGYDLTTTQGRNAAIATLTNLVSQAGGAYTGLESQKLGLSGLSKAYSPGLATRQGFNEMMEAWLADQKKGNK